MQNVSFYEVLLEFLPHVPIKDFMFTCPYTETARFARKDMRESENRTLHQAVSSYIKDGGHESSHFYPDAPQSHDCLPLQTRTNHSEALRD